MTKPKRSGRVIDRIKAVAAAHPDWSLRQIAESCGCDRDYVRRVVGAKRAAVLRDRLSRDAMMEMILAGMSDGAIAEKVGAVRSSVSALRNRYGLAAARDVIPGVANAITAQKRRASVQEDQQPMAPHLPWPAVDPRLRAAWDRGEGPDFRSDNLSIRSTGRHTRLTRPDLHSITGCSAALAAALGGT